ncbi:A24 family peptidase [Rheinheimera texasensis]|uniref:prepilin peptidase n=1 Tax=Rheinheimera texasensis TaxID=306205 RepID=UPI0032B1030F
MPEQLSLIVSFLQQNPIWLISTVVLFSLCVGSFLNVVIYRLPVMMEKSWQQEYREYFQPDEPALPAETFNLATPRSRCQNCQTQLSALDNIPLLSWLSLGGKCRYCKAPISPRYPAVELLTAVLSGLVIWQTGATAYGMLLLVLTWCLVALTFIDIDKMLLPDQITLPLLWLVLAASAAGIGIAPQQAIIGAACGYLSLWSVYWGFKLLTGKEGMGYGDFKLMAIFGALLGWQQLPLIILLSSVVGAVIGSVMLAVQKKGQNTAIPFGPYIAAAGWIAMLWGSQISDAYLRSIGL